MKKLITGIVVLLVILFAGISLTLAYFKSLKTINQQDVYFIVKNGSTAEEISNLLKSKSIIKSKDIFLIYAKLNKFSGNIKGSKLIIKPNTNYRLLISKLQNAQSDFSVVTIPEGFRFYQIGERLERDTPIKKEDFLKISVDALEQNNIISKRKNTYFDLEGFLYPDTYYIPYGFTEKDATNLMFSRFKSVFSEEYINRAKELNLNINEVITIASLIEREAANNNERSRISGVIYNRIKKDMPLQIDASVIYAVTKGHGTMQKVVYKDLKVQDAYNTYLNRGLPPGPIASPGKPSIEAALYPEDNDYFYYVSNGREHVFSRTYEEHLKNIKKYIK